MTIDTLDNSLKVRLNDADPASLASGLQTLRFGNMLRALPTYLRKQTAVASSYELSTLKGIVLPDDAKANSIFRAFARVGTGTPAELTVKLYGVTPSTGEIAVSPNGNIVTLGSEAWTNFDVLYLPEKQAVIELTLAVTSNAATIPAAYVTRGVVSLLEVESLVGTVTGKLVSLVPSGSAATTGTARLDLAHATVKFYSGDAVTSARIKFGVSSLTDVNALLEAASTVL